MSRLPTGRMGQVIAVLLVAVLVAACWSGVAAPLLDWHAERGANLERRATLARRMAQIAADLPALEQAAARPSAGPAKIAVLDGGTDAVAGAALQQKLQELAAQAGAPLASVESLPAEQLGAYRRIAVRASVNAPWPPLVKLLAAIESASPQMLADELEVHGNRGFIRDAAASLDASFVVMGFRAGTAGP